ncbi:tRNA dihydrouridine synthase DusB [Leucothrix pacifica]|uniref:tRNA-dihydrouridine synthase n=1 Tax=Leucothrix pacifica TaxID=1247513 RepID=A0A317CC75_9GAMM|nr:tRNA dihydrouridine synthase DusB [Leucothrix pacifica]PWQ94943.1 tRNA dihydrouridine synthase DusB [Leucothrix pacifica]
MLKIAQYTLSSPLLQAPMAGVTDRVYRDIVREHGAGMATSEMVTSQLSLLKTQKTQLRLPQLDECSPRSIQIVGTDPDTMAEAARHYVNIGAEIIDINFGCPVKKVAGSKQLAGSALLKDEQKVEQIISRVVEATGNIPVTVKYRTGWCQSTRNAVRIAKIAEQAGVAALALHGRTREDKYKPYAEYESIRQVKKHANSIPIIANGDIAGDEEQARFILDYTQADGLMIGRASFGRPWIFSELNHSLFGIPTKEITWQYKRDIALKHLESVHDFYRDSTSHHAKATTSHTGFANKVINWYLLSMSIQTNLRPRLLKSRTPGEQISLFKEVLDAAA